MASRSPSPNPSRPKTPDPAGVRRSTGSIIPSKPTESPSRPRTPDNSSVRRSTGSLNPSRPTAPADSSRNSGYKASRDLLPSLRSADQNENDKDPNSLKTPRAKGVKSFMAPTISASSKVIAASPRKKILGERNEVVSVSESLVLGEEIRKKPEVGSGFWDVLGSPDARTPDLDSRSYKYAATPSFTPTPAPSPVDADPSSMPYDPKTNPLAPRPQFLYYKPSPSVEEGKQLEESFSSESYEDQIDDGSEEAASELHQNEGLNLEETEESTEEAVSVLQRDEEEESAASAESCLKPNGKQRKSRLFTLLKAVPVLFIMVMAFLYAPLSDSPAFSPSRSFILENLNGAASRLREWSSSSFSHLTVPSLPKEFGPYDLVNLTFSTMDQTVDSDSIFSTPKLDLAHLITEPEQPVEEKTVQGVEVSVENDIEDVVVHGDVGEEARPVESENEVNCVEELELESSPLAHDAVEQITLEVLKEEEYNSVEEEINSVEIVTVSGNDAAPDIEEQIMMEEHREEKFSLVDEDIEEEGMATENYEDSVKEEEYNSVEKEANSVEIVAESENDAAPDTEEQIMMEEHREEKFSSVDEGIKEEGMATENYEDSVKDMNQERTPSGQDDTSNIEEIVEEHQDASLSLAISPETIHDQHTQIQLGGFVDSLLGGSDQLSVRSVLGLSAAVIVLATTLAILYKKKKKQSSVLEQNVLPPETEVSVSASSDNFDGAEKNVKGDSGQEKRDNGVDSWSNDDRRTRRDSTISSSNFYGSYTTLEKISAKKGYGDDEVVTPVRRSSRIRSKVASPTVKVEP